MLPSPFRMMARAVSGCWISWLTSSLARWAVVSCGYPIAISSDIDRPLPIASGGDRKSPPCHESRGNPPPHHPEGMNPPCWILPPAPACSAVQGAGARPRRLALGAGRPHRGVGASGSIRTAPMRKQRASPSICRSACHEVGWGSGAASVDRSCGHGRLGKAVAGARRGSVLDAGQPTQRAVGRTGQGGPPASSGAMSIPSPPSHLFGSARRIEQGHPLELPVAPGVPDGCWPTR
jgi:hypothetical protein